MSLLSRFSARRRTLIGVVHLQALPGSPRSARSLREIRLAAVNDAKAYFKADCDGVIVENFGDVPFLRDSVPAVVVASMTALALAVKDVAASRPVGVNVLRNAACDALAVATGAELDFIRVNVLTSVSVADQGLIEGDAARLMRQRRELAPDVAVLADLRVKHAAPLREGDLDVEVEELTQRALADVVLVTGKTTGRAPSEQHLTSVVAAAGATPVMVASGISADSVHQFAAAAGYVVGSSLKRGGVLAAPVDPKRVAALRKAIDSLTPKSRGSHVA